jgi:hypothetical protein
MDGRKTQAAEDEDHRESERADVRGKRADERKDDQQASKSPPQPAVPPPKAD